jgi:hypothetical protein
MFFFQRKPATREYAKYLDGMKTAHLFIRFDVCRIRREREGVNEHKVGIGWK